MKFQGKVASTSGNWRLLAGKGGLIERVYSGMRVGEDSTACLSLEPQHALVELSIERDLLGVHVLSRRGESETPPIWVNLRGRVQITLPNNVLLLTCEGETDDSDTDLIEIQVRPKLLSSNVPEKHGVVPFADGKDIDFGKPRRLLTVNVSIALAALGMLVLIPLVFLSREIAGNAVNGQVQQAAKVVDLDSSAEDVVVSVSDNTVLPPSVRATDQPQLEEIALRVEGLQEAVDLESINPTADQSVETKSLEDPAQKTDSASALLMNDAQSTAARSDPEKEAVTLGAETRAPVLANLGEPDGAEFRAESVVAPSPEILSNGDGLSARDPGIDESTEQPAVDVTRPLTKTKVEVAVADAVDGGTVEDSIALPNEVEQAVSVPPVNPELIVNESIVESPVAVDFPLGDAGADLANYETLETVALSQPEQTERTLPVEFSLPQVDEAEVDTSEFLSEGFEAELGIAKELGMQGADAGVSIEEGINQLLTPSLEVANLSSVETESEFALGEAPLSVADKEDSDSPTLYPFSDLTVLRQRPPTYPRAAPRGTSGSVEVEFTVTENGRVDDMKVQGDPPDYFARSALKALRGWRFKAIVVDGKPVPVRTVLRLSFRG